MTQQIDKARRGLARASRMRPRRLPLRHILGLSRYKQTVLVHTSHAPEKQHVRAHPSHIHPLPQQRTCALLRSRTLFSIAAAGVENSLRKNSGQ